MSEWSPHEPDRTDVQLPDSAENPAEGLASDPHDTSPVQTPSEDELGIRSGSNLATAPKTTRADVLSGGVLIDVSATARRADIRWPLALTCAAWECCVTVPPRVACQDEAGRP